MEIGVRAIEAVIVLVMMAVAAITSWILGALLRRRIKESLGIEARNEMQLTSLRTWIDVHNIEERNRGGKLR